MVDFLSDLIGMALTDYVPKIFGAFLKWIYLRFKIPYSKVLEMKGNATIGFVSLGIIILATLIIINMDIKQ